MNTDETLKAYTQRVGENKLTKEVDDMKGENFSNCVRFGRFLKLRDEEIEKLKLVKTQKEEVIDFLKSTLRPLFAKIDELKEENEKLKEGLTQLST